MGLEDQEQFPFNLDEPEIARFLWRARSISQPSFEPGATFQKMPLGQRHVGKVSCGHPSVRTPHIDALAADGVLFPNHFTVASACGPARASLLTGLYLHNHRSVRNGVPLDRRHDNLALAMARQGYRAASARRGPNREARAAA